MADGFPLTGFEPSRVAKKLRCRAEGCILLKKEKKIIFELLLGLPAFQGLLWPKHAALKKFWLLKCTEESKETS